MHILFINSSGGFRSLRRLVGRRVGRSFPDRSGVGGGSIRDQGLGARGVLCGKPASTRHSLCIRCIVPLYVQVSRPFAGAFGHLVSLSRGGHSWWNVRKYPSPGTAASGAAAGRLSTLRHLRHVRILCQGLMQAGRLRPSVEQVLAVSAAPGSNQSHHASDEP